MNQESALLDVHLRDDAHKQIMDVTEGAGITIIGCSAQREADGENVKLKLWNSGHVLKSGPTAESLSR